jgi:pyridinium-3,5-biscarboxylic acid mononucleotide sulfurtransferase
MDVVNKYQQLQQIILGLKKVVVAYSGGVDSTFLLKAAVDTLGAANVLACIGVSNSMPAKQLERALKYAKSIGASVQQVKVNELYDSEYSANNPDRCFHCKSHLYQVIKKIAEEKGFSHVLCGTNLDDMDDYRPGNRAAENQSVRSVLAEAGLTKQDIRNISRKLKLPTADVPSSPCLASRITYGLKITRERLGQVEQAEEFLRTLGFIEFRVRHHDTIARIEVTPADIVKVLTEPNRSKIIKKFKSIGFKYIAVDLQGYRSGSLNEVLPATNKKNN